MPSPFPGMDPYLEDPAFWRDLHHRFIGSWSEFLGDLLPDNYEARIDEHVRLVEVPAEADRRILPDIAITQRGPSKAASAGAAGTLLLEPVTVLIPILEEVREAHIEILHRPERALVGVLELLSPPNKSDHDRGNYLAKRTSVLRQNVHLVELDLLIGGLRLPMRRPLPPGDYYALVARGDRRPNCDVYAWNVRQPLPTIPIPLKAPDPDIHCNLAAVFGMAYERGRYARSLNYREPPKVPLNEEDLRWVIEQSKSASR